LDTPLDMRVHLGHEKANRRPACGFGAIKRAICAPEQLVGSAPSFGAIAMPTPTPNSADTPPITIGSATAATMRRARFVGSSGESIWA